jgi:2-C-methyl-D-erythritol 2,4-cyclodiphosphate synthase
LTIRCGFGFDAHRLVEGRAFVLGGVRVPFERGPLGHSDGDALTHAVADAILGACALGDLGALFPSSDARWKDADSLDLLAQCARRVQERGYRVVNVDATIVVEAPKLAPHCSAMAATLARVLNVAPEAVSVKAKTSDGMGYTGDGSGVAAYAVASLEAP